MANVAFFLRLYDTEGDPAVPGIHNIAIDTYSVVTDGSSPGPGTSMKHYDNMPGMWYVAAGLASGKYRICEKHYITGAWSYLDFCLNVPITVGDLAAMASDIATAKVNIDAAELAITAVEGDVSAMASSIEAISDAIDAAEADLVEMKGTGWTHIMTIKFTYDKVNSASSSISALGATTQTLQEDVHNIDTAVYQNRTAMANYTRQTNYSQPS